MACEDESNSIIAMAAREGAAFPLPALENGARIPARPTHAPFFAIHSQACFGILLSGASLPGPIANILAAVVP